jgi:galactosylceramidase
MKIRFVELVLIVLVTACGAHASDAAIQTVRLEGQAAGKRFEGIGVVNGGGATPVLFKGPIPRLSD